MSVIGNSVVRYSDLIDTMFGNLISIPQNLVVYKSSVPEYLKYPYTDTQDIPVQGGYTPKINWENNSYASTVSRFDFENDYRDFMNKQLLSIGVNMGQVVTAPLLIKLLTSMYCYITARFIRVFHPKYTGSALFVNLTLQPTVNTTNVVNLSSISTDGNIQDIINALCNQAKAGVRSLMVTNSYTSTF